MNSRAAAVLAFAVVLASSLVAIAVPALSFREFQDWLWFATLYFAVAGPVLVGVPLGKRLVRAARRGRRSDWGVPGR